jgi:hypothetical protein
MTAANRPPLPICERGYTIAVIIIQTQISKLWPATAIAPSVAKKPDGRRLIAGFYPLTTILSKTGEISVARRQFCNRFNLDQQMV